MSNNNTLGTLIVVVIRARHLPDRSRIGVGKPSPYTTLTYGLTKHQTKPIKRGGQTPQFDEEFRFEVPTQEEDFLTNETASISKSGGIVPITASSAPVVSNSQHPTINSGRKALRIALFADDSKAPRMIGEAVLDLSAVFVKGEHDAWIPLEYKGRPAGEVYLECTFYSNSVPASQQRLPRASNDHGYERVDSTQLHSNYSEREERDEMYHEEDVGRFDRENTRHDPYQSQLPTLPQPPHQYHEQHTSQQSRMYQPHLSPNKHTHYSDQQQQQPHPQQYPLQQYYPREIRHDQYPSSTAPPLPPRPPYYLDHSQVYTQYHDVPEQHRPPTEGNERYSTEIQHYPSHDYQQHQYFSEEQSRPSALPSRPASAPLYAPVALPPLPPPGLLPFTDLVNHSPSEPTSQYSYQGYGSHNKGWSETR